MRLLFLFRGTRRCSSPSPILLGRWCRPDTHDSCDVGRKADLANADNSLGGARGVSLPPPAAPRHNMHHCSSVLLELIRQDHNRDKHDDKDER